MAYSFLDLAIDVLEKSPIPLTYQEIWDEGCKKGLAGKIKTEGKTPWQTLGARLYVEIRDNKSSNFIKVGKRPARFFLRNRRKEIKEDLILELENKTISKTEKTITYHERDLHPILAYYASTNPSFNRGRSIYTKTIYHEKSKKGGFNEWVHPDMVGFYLPLENWHKSVIEFNRVSDNNSLRLFSFEIKKSLNKVNYRESYFQAVSNSSWAHEGYLAAAEIIQNDDLLSELERLASSFGIGIIHLNLNDIDGSPILYPAKQREVLDWETINKLCEQNEDFESFIDNVKIDFESKKIHAAEYDGIPKNINQYILSKLLSTK